MLVDNFESGRLDQWSSTGLSGDGTVSVVPEGARTGGCGALIHVTSSPSSRAFLGKDLGGATEVWAEGWFNVQADGLSGSNVPLWRGFDPSWNRLFDVYRTNVAGELWLRVPDGSGVPGSYAYTKLQRTIPRDTWHQTRLHVATATGTVQVWYDGTQVADLTGQPVGASIGMLQAQSEHHRQLGDLAVDDTMITTVP